MYFNFKEVFLTFFLTWEALSLLLGEHLDLGILQQRTRDHLSEGVEEGPDYPCSKLN